MAKYNSIIEAVHAGADELIANGIVPESVKTLDAAATMKNIAAALLNQTSAETKAALKAAYASSDTTIADQIAMLMDITNDFVTDANPLTALTVDVEVSGSEDLLGKYISDLQEDVEIDGNVVKGKLNYVDGYTLFSSNPEQQSGHYLVLHASVPEVTGYTIKAFITQESTLDNDGILIIRIADHNKDKGVTFTVTKEGYGPISKTYKFSGLKLLAAEDDD